MLTPSDSADDKNSGLQLSPIQAKDLENGEWGGVPMDNSLRTLSNDTLDAILQETNAGAVLIIPLSRPILTQDIDATKLQFGFCTANIGPGMIPVLLRFLLMALKGGLDGVFKKL